MPFDNAPWRDPVTERIERAIACLEERGWCQGSVSDDDGRVCVLGAFSGAGSVFADVTVAALNRVASVAGGSPYYNLARWNDSLPPQTGKQVVLDVLRRAAAEVG